MRASRLANNMSSRLTFEWSTGVEWLFDVERSINYFRRDEIRRIIVALKVKQLKKLCKVGQIFRFYVR